MLSSCLVALTLSFAPPKSCEIWVYEGDPWPKPTAECPSWTIYQPFPEDPDLDINLLRPERIAQRGCVLELIRVRDSFIGVMTDQAAGMLANPVALSPE